MKYWKEHTALRVTLMAATFVLGAVLMVLGWGAFDKLLGLSLSGKLPGLFIMLAGIALLLTCLSLYNKPFEEPKAPKKKKSN